MRQADPKYDYPFDAEAADSAIVVSLSWLDESAACDALSCNPGYPRGEECSYDDAPRVFPSGDSTTLTACEPACYMFAALSGDDAPADLAARRYASDECRVMLRDGTWTARGEKGRSLAGGYAATDAAGGPRRPSLAPRAPDLPPLEYSRSSGRCELANMGLLSFVTQPYHRSVGHDVCRQDNFLTGDDLVPMAIEGEARTERHSLAYCAAFYKRLDPETKACEETVLDRVLCFTFLGNALVRLGRHAAYGDGCATLFPADAERAETSETAVATMRRSRAAWYADANRSWCLPPPNVLLSDLGVTGPGQVWSNRGDGASLADMSVARARISRDVRRERASSHSARATLRRA